MPGNKAPELLVSSTGAWRDWLGKNNSKSAAIQLVVARQPGTKPDITYQDALDEALCHGWIDSGGGPRDEGTRYVRFGPRKTNSAWSRRNIGFVERLLQEGRMADSGRAAVERAKTDGFWQVAYSADHVPNDLQTALEQSENGAEAAWQDMAKKERYLTLVKMAGFPLGSEVRTKKIQSVVRRLENQQIDGEEKDKEIIVSTGNGADSDTAASSTNMAILPEKASRRSSRLANSRRGLVEARSIR